MGMFDYVRYEADCWKCKEPLSDFQSKDHHCTMATISPKKVKSFYTSCKNCEAWNEFKVKVKVKRIDRIIPYEPPTRMSRSNE